MNTIAALSDIRNIALNKADACETVFAMNLHFAVARELGRIIQDLRVGIIDLAVTAKAGWTKIVIDDRATCDAQREGFTALLQDLRDLGIVVVHTFARPAKKRPEFDFGLAA